MLLPEPHLDLYNSGAPALISHQICYPLSELCGGGTPEAADTEVPSGLLRVWRGGGRGWSGRWSGKALEEVMSKPERG